MSPVFHLHELKCASHDAVEKALGLSRYEMMKLTNENSFWCSSKLDTLCNFSFRFHRSESESEFE